MGNCRRFIGTSAADSKYAAGAVPSTGKSSVVVDDFRLEAPGSVAVTLGQTQETEAGAVGC